MSKPRRQVPYLRRIPLTDHRLPLALHAMVNDDIDAAADPFTDRSKANLNSSNDDNSVIINRSAPLHFKLVRRDDDADGGNDDDDDDNTTTTPPADTKTAPGSK